MLPSRYGPIPSLLNSQEDQCMPPYVPPTSPTERKRLDPGHSGSQSLPVAV